MYVRDLEHSKVPLVLIRGLLRGTRAWGERGGIRIERIGWAIVRHFLLLRLTDWPRTLVSQKEKYRNDM